MNGLPEAIEDTIFDVLLNTHTIIVAKIVSVNDVTVNVKPVINRMFNGESVELGVFPDVPPIFLGGGGDYTAYKISEGDYCLLLVSERCFDAWYHGSDYVAPAEKRMFDYSDCFALVGINPLAKAITIPKRTTVKGDILEVGDFTHNGDYDVIGDMTVSGDTEVGGNTDSDTYSTGGVDGATGVFTTHDGTVVTVTNGLITGIE